MKSPRLPKQLLATLLVFSIALPGAPELFAQAAAQRAGQVAASIPVGQVERPGVRQPTDVGLAVLWDDLVTTAARGRVRIGLDDGSALNVGSNASLRVVQHDATSQQSELTLVFGQMRVRTKLQQPGARFTVRTNTAVIGVIGTDFWVEATATLTRVIVFEGAVEVTSLGGTRSKVMVGAGQWTTVASEQDPAPPSSPNSSDYNNAIADTEVGEPLPEPAGPRKAWHKSPALWVAIGFAAAVTVLAIVVATDEEPSTPSSYSPPEP
jgi:hypothetical protein